MPHRFAFHGSALGVAGSITRPEDHLIEVQGTSVLPVIGGLSQSTIQKCPCPSEYLSFSHVATRAVGNFDESQRAFTTLVWSSVHHLEIAKRLTADLVEATMMETQPEKGGQPSFSLRRTRIENLRIDGYPIDPDLQVESYTAPETRDKFLKRNRRLKLPVHNDVIYCSIAGNPKTEHPKVRVEGHVLILPGFGRIFLGELLIKSGSRRLTLLRVKLGSPVEGDVACSEIESNGDLLPF